MPASSEQVFSARARSLFAGLVRELDEGRELDIERLCAAHPDLADELRSLHANWTRLDGVLDRLLVASETSPVDAESRDPERAEPRDRARAETHELLRRLSEVERSRSRYEILDEIARGGMGVVLHAHDSTLERDLAMKLVRDPGATRDGGGRRRLARFLDEARMTAKLDHPGIVPIHDVGIDDRGRVFFTMPLVRGRKLTEVIELVREGREGWTQARALEVVLKVCDAVSYAHSVGVVHRDLKPDNVMIGRFGETYLMDWGLARMLSLGSETRAPDDVLVRDPEPASSAREQTFPAHDPHAVASRDPHTAAARDPHTADGAVLGTPAYMAPEQAAAKHAEVGPQADIYSVGAILYHLLCGRAPYSDELGPESAVEQFEAPDSKPIVPSSAERRVDRSPAPRGILDAVLDAPPTPITKLEPRVPPELAAICAKAMARARSRRYADMRAMSDDLRAYMEGRVVRAHEGGAPAELRKWIARNKRLSLAIAGAVLTAIVGLAAVSYVQTASKNEILKLSDLRRVETLEREAESLWPAVPKKARAMERWLADAEALLENRAWHARMLQEMRSALSSESSSDPYAEQVSDNADRWRFENQARLVAALDRLADPDPRRGLIANVRKRMSEARELHAASVGDHAEEWSRAVRSIADESECPLYRGAKIAPQVGLIPLGRDPRSNLWEFAHLASGAPAQRTADGALVSTEKTGIVLVLIPGGASTIGSQPPKPGRPADPFTDSLSQLEEQPPVEVELAPFFLSKYELTRAQWRRWCALDPSAPRIETLLEDPAISSGRSSADRASAEAGSAEVAAESDRLPIGSISWFEAAQSMSHMGLTLPTEAQWEHAARAGTRTRWWCGNEPRLLVETANVGSGIDGSLPYTDLFDGPAPVDALPPNPWGLHHVHGNVSEWTQDSFWPRHDRSLRAIDGKTIAPDSGLRAVRGGSYLGSAAIARSAARAGVAPANHDASIGVRPARALDP
jgi:serine/threonine protein kinase